MRHLWRCHVLTLAESRDPRARNGAEREGFHPVPQSKGHRWDTG